MVITKDDVKTLVRLSLASREYVEMLDVVIAQAKQTGDDSDESKDTLKRLEDKRIMAKQAEESGVLLVNRAYQNFKVNHKAKRVNRKTR